MKVSSFFQICPSFLICVLLEGGHCPPRPGPKFDIYETWDIIQVENPKNQDAFSKQPRFRFLGVIITSKLACIEPWTQEFNFLKFPFVSGFMDFSMKFKSFPVLAYIEIHSFKLKIPKNQDSLSKKIKIQLLGVLFSSKFGPHQILDSGI